MGNKFYVIKQFYQKQRKCRAPLLKIMAFLFKTPATCPCRETKTASWCSINGWQVDALIWPIFNEPKQTGKQERERRQEWERKTWKPPSQKTFEHQFSSHFPFAFEDKKEEPAKDTGQPHKFPPRFSTAPNHTLRTYPTRCNRTGNGSSRFGQLVATWCQLSARLPKR